MAMDVGRGVLTLAADGGDPRPAAVSFALLGRITDRRAQLLGLVAAHHTNPQIADLLGVAPATVKHTIEELRRLTQSRSKRDLARWWLTHRERWAAMLGQPRP